MALLRFPLKPCGVTIKNALKQEPYLKKYLISEEPIRLDLGNPQALNLYNRVILKDFLGLDFQIPSERFLIPTICSRWSFIQWVLSDLTKKMKFINEAPRLLEIGTGASAIIAMMLAKIGCLVEATEIDERAYNSANKNIKRNQLDNLIKLHKSDNQIIIGLFNNIENFDAIICNPPQYDKKYYEQITSLKGFRGQESELLGGNEGYEFTINLVKEAKSFPVSSKLYFQITVSKLESVISNMLEDMKCNYRKAVNTLGTRKRFYFCVEFS